FAEPVRSVWTVVRPVRPRGAGLRVSAARVRLAGTGLRVPAPADAAGCGPRSVRTAVRLDARRLRARSERLRFGAAGRPHAGAVRSERARRGRARSGTGAAARQPAGSAEPARSHAAGRRT